MFKRYLAVFGVAALLTGLAGFSGLPAKADTVTASPTGLTGMAQSSTSISLSWGAVTNASTTSGTLSGYDIIRNGAQVATTTATSYVDTGLSPMTTYGYNVSAYDSAGSTSPWSNTVYLQTLASGTSTGSSTLPSVPMGLTGSANGSAGINLSWTASTDNNYPQNQLVYIIYRDGTQVGTTTAGALTFADTGLSASTSYNYTIAAVDPGGNMSGQSAMVTVMTQSAGAGTPTTIPSTGTFGWIIIPQSLYNQVFNASSSSTTTNSVYTYINGYPTINGNYYDCSGNIDNDMAHHSTNASDTDPAHHIGQNCSGGAPAAPSMSGTMNGNGMMNGNQPIQSFFAPGTGVQWVIIPLNAQTLQALWQAINVLG